MNDNKLNESVLDPIRITRCEDLFDNVKSKNPSLKKEVRDYIISIANKFYKI